MSNGGFLAPRRPRAVGHGSASAIQPHALAPQTRPLSPAERSSRRARRDPAILDALRRLDAGPDLHAQTEILEWLRKAYDARAGGVLVGLFGHCYLGAPYVDHVFDLTGQIMEHFTPSDTVPPVYGPARPLALSEAYAYIEIYSDGAIVAIRPDGTPVA